MKVRMLTHFRGFIAAASLKRRMAEHGVGHLVISAASLPRPH